MPLFSTKTMTFCLNASDLNFAPPKMDVSGSLLKIREWMFKHKFHFTKPPT